MPCEQTVKDHFLSLGIDPLPSHIKDMIPLMCGHMHPKNIAIFLYRMWAWTRRLTALRRLYLLTDEQVAKLEKIFFDNGFGAIFRAELATFTCKSGTSSNRLNRICSDEQKSLARLAEFEKIRKALDESPNGIFFSEAFVDELEFDFVACGNSSQDVADAAFKYANASQPLKKQGLAPEPKQ